MIDVNVSLFRWPFRRLPAGDGPAVVKKLREQRVTQAWTGTFEALLDQDLTAANARLAAACRQLAPDLLVPFGAINPKSPGWRDDLQRCHDSHGMPGIRLHPGYHGYTLDDPAFAELLALAVEKHLLVEIALSMEDVRTQNPLFRVPPVDAAPLERLLGNGPRAGIVLLNARHGSGARKLAASGRVYFDFSMVEGVGGVAKLAETVSSSRVVFGSNFPLFYFESTIGKIHEAGFAPAIETAVREGNARSLLAG
ncbi:MAG: amidohydrolase family protein [Acidobacteria bacterium]|nr:amidohydrolase family protein [Acidobacteriota bacterium]